MTQKLALLTIAILLISCSPEKRLARLLAKNPQLTKVDTLTIRDTIKVNGVTKDTVFRTQVTKDTVVIKEKHLTIKYYNDGNSTYLKGACDTIKVYYEKQIPIDRIINETMPIAWYKQWYLWLLVGCVGSLVLTIYLRK